MSAFPGDFGLFV